MIRCIYLDFDGTLVDSLPIMREIFSLFLKTYDIDEKKFQFNTYNGLTLIEIVKDIKENAKLKNNVNKLFSDYFSLIQAHFPKASPMAYAIDLLKFAKIKNISVNIVTSNALSIVQSWLEKNQKKLNFNIKHIVHGDLGLSGKPNKALYTHAIQLSGFPIDEAIAVEDSVKGMKAASDAGLKTYFLSRQVFPSKDKVIPIASLKELLEKLRLQDSDYRMK